MKEIILKSIHMENFKRFKKETLEFSELTKIFAQNYKGKSSIADAFNWALFGKSATGNAEGKQFRVRRYDENGVDIDRVLVVVELLLEIDGKEILINKTQKQNWVRKRGTEAEVHEGNSNIYHWNEVEVKQTEHNKRVTEIINEDLFKKLTNPHAFPTMHEKEQREFLIDHVAKLTDEDIFALDSGFLEIKALMDNNSLEEIKAINKKALTGYKKKQEEIPTRIDEASKLILDVEFSSKELELNALKEQIAEVEKKQLDTSKAYEDVGKIQKEISEYKTKASEIERAEEDLLSTKTRDLKSKVDDLTYKLSRTVERKTSVGSDIEALKEKLSSSEIFLKTLQKRYAEQKAEGMDEEKNTCPVCAREFQEEKRQEMLNQFEKDKKAKMKAINVDGGKALKLINEDKKKLQELEKQLVELTAEVSKLEAEEKVKKEELKKIPTEIDLSKNKDYQGYLATIKALEFSLKETNESLKDTDTLKENLVTEKQEIQAKIDEVQKVLASKVTSDDAKDRVEELKEELKQATKLAAEKERLSLLLERFESSKNQLLSETVNKHFKLVKWQLFYKQANGIVVDTCVPTIHGSPYGDNTTSTTEKLMIGLDIISTLQKIHEVKAPIFIDNAEAYNDFNIPEMDCQMIQLHVSEDREIKVEGWSHDRLF